MNYDRNIALYLFATRFLPFLKRAYEEIHPNAPLQDNWHLAAMAFLLEAIQTRGTGRAVITMPPRSLKSFTVSAAWPAFLLGLDPTAKIMVASYGERLAKELSNITRRLMRSDFYRSVFPKTELDEQSALLLTTTLGGQRMATSITGSMTGFGADWIIIDDPMNAQELPSAAARAEVLRFYKSVVATRSNNPAKRKILVVMQRLHVEDLAGHLIASGWTELRLQACATTPALVEIGKNETHEVKVGDIFHPTYLPSNTLDELREEMGFADYSAQYLQEPIPVQGIMFKRDWIVYCPRPSVDRGELVISLDTAFKAGVNNDYSAWTIWLKRDTRHYLIEAGRGKLLYPDLKARVLTMLGSYPTARLLVEDHGSGSDLIADLRDMGYPVLPCQSRNSKEDRANSATDFFASDRVRFVRETENLEEFEAEIFSFPHGKHDDSVDSLSQYFGWVREQKRQSEFQYWPLDAIPDGPPDIADMLIDWRRRRVW